MSTQAYDFTGEAQTSIRMRWREPYLTEGLNRKEAIFTPRGIYRGFCLKPSLTALQVKVEGDAEHSDCVAACLASGGYLVSVHRTGAAVEVDLTAYAGKQVVLALYAIYAVGAATTVVLRVYEVSPTNELDVAPELDDLLILGTVQVPASGVIPVANISESRRTYPWENVAVDAKPWKPLLRNAAFHENAIGAVSYSSCLHWDLFDVTNWQVTDADAFVGDRCLECEALGNGDPTYADAVFAYAVVPGQRLRYRIAHKILLAQDPFDVRLSFSLEDGGSGTSVSLGTIDALVLNQWRVLEGVVQVPAGCHVVTGLRVQTGGDLSTGPWFRLGFAQIWMEDLLTSEGSLTQDAFVRQVRFRGAVPAGSDTAVQGTFAQFRLSRADGNNDSTSQTRLIVPGTTASGERSIYPYAPGAALYQKLGEQPKFESYWRRLAGIPSQMTRWASAFETGFSFREFQAMEGNYRTWNARWNATTTQWQADWTAEPATRLVQNGAGLALQRRAVTTSPWASWDSLMQVSATNTNVLMGHLAGGTSGNWNTAVGTGALAAGATTDSVAIGASAAGNTTGAHNVAVGTNALLGVPGSSGGYNVGVGSQALLGLTVGEYNVSIGYQGMWDVTSGSANVGVGLQVMALGAVGSYNVGMGAHALSAGVGGSFNLALGYYAMGLANVLGERNIAVGSGSLSALTLGSNNVSVGDGSATGLTEGTGNVVLGYQAMRLNQGIDNVFIGRQANGQNSTSGGESLQNVGIGANALTSLLGNGIEHITTGTGFRNTAVGYAALDELELGNGQTAVGARAGEYSIGNLNTFLGYEAGRGPGTDPFVGEYNVCVGPYAGHTLRTGESNVLIGMQSGQGLTTGSTNVFVGTESGNGVTDGVDNVIVGRRAGISGPSAPGSNNVFVGVNSSCTGSNSTLLGANTGGATSGDFQVVIGARAWAGVSNVGVLNLYDQSVQAPTTPYTFAFGSGLWPIAVVAGGFAPYSDRAVKANIEDLPLGLEFLCGLRPRTYDKKVPHTRAAARKHMGFVAQELKEDCLAQGQSLSIYWDDAPEGSWSVEYDQLTAPLVKAVQELAAKVQDLQAQLDALKGGK